ncbi:phage tail domain-containing protein [Arthrobacter sp. GMC3]|uniref:phage tail domain-containing protein n=1 Tax=Arthrobacter sp. GMC3 TaxID=2058894 RepID=UPI000CE3BDAB|nr:phage tail domain-containing protein [Arthrobacter sp. GMC3]
MTTLYKMPASQMVATLGALQLNQWAPEGYFLKALRMPGWKGTPGVRKDTTPRLWAHGDFSERGWRTGRLITIEGRANLPTEAALLAAHEALSSALADGTEGMLVVDDPIFGVLHASVSLATGSDLPGWEVPGIYPFQIQVTAADPRKYGQTLSGSTGVPVDGGGLGYDLYTVGSTGVLDYGAAGSPGIVSLTNVGTADTAPVYTITGSCPNGFSITEIGTGRRLVYAGAVITGQVIRLDTADGSVTLDDDGDRGAQLVRREWVRLGKGQTGTWLFEAPGSTNALLKTEVTPAWW